ncbi:MAG TPA: HAD family phosphatase [Bryobacteraceae bacterium]|nr:HAD family phosphatase [Bryobacteraceae bacterium]
MPPPAVRALFVDIGGVLATNGWDTESREAAVEHFNLDEKLIDSRHRLMFELFETGKISWMQYMERVVFNVPRPFTYDEFTRFVLAHSRPYPDMIDLVRRVKENHKLKVVVVSNEGRELTEYRLKLLDLASVVDVFVCSCFVRLRKPDLDIFRLACDLAQVGPQEVVYLEDRAMFVEVAATLGIRGIVVRGVDNTRAALAALGLYDQPAALSA